MRIAWIGPCPSERGGGVPRVAGILVRGLADLGHELDCYVAHRDEGAPAWLGDDVPLHDPGSRWHYGAWYSSTPVASFVSSLASRAAGLRRIASKLAENHRRRPYDVVYQFSHLEAPGLRRHLETLPPLVVHPQTHVAGELAWVRRERGLDGAGPTRQALVRAVLAARARRQRRDAQLARGFVFPSARFRDHVVRDYGIDPSRTRVVPNPIDLSFFRGGARESGHPVRIAFVGRIAVRKGIDSLVELSRRLGDLEGSVTLDVVGHPSQWSDYRPLLEALDPRVARFDGSRPATGIRDLLAETDLLVQPSKYEPFGLTVGEALASGVPVVATEEVGATEQVSRDCAAVVPASDPDALEAAVRTMVERLRNGDAARLRTLARAEAERLFDPRVVCRSLATALEELAR